MQREGERDIYREKTQQALDLLSKRERTRKTGGKDLVDNKRMKKNKIKIKWLCHFFGNRTVPKSEMDWGLRRGSLQKLTPSEGDGYFRDGMKPMK